jgi:hypothetical protein
MSHFFQDPTGAIKAKEENKEFTTNDKIATMNSNYNKMVKWSKNEGRNFWTDALSSEN